MGAPSPVFVAGTGRCGTSQLAHVLDEHPLIHRISGETHFIVDPGGLRDLADALTVRYDPSVGDDALRRLDDMLRVRLVERNDASFPGGNVPAAVGERHYWDAVGQLERDWPAQRSALFEHLDHRDHQLDGGPARWSKRRSPT